MDNLTHTLTGVVLSRAGLNRIAPRPTLTLVLAANAPDIDVVTSAWGALAYLKYHRGVTHALVGLPIMAALVAGIVWLLSPQEREKFPWGRIYGVALLGVATHPLMDFTNIYGIRPWLPFNGTWRTWDIISVVDLWVWVVFAVCLAAPALGRLISGEIGAQPGAGRGAAMFVLVFVPAWWGVHDLAHRRALAMLDAHLYGSEGEGVAPRRVAAFPSPTNPLVWRGLVETDRFYQTVLMNVLSPFDPTRGQIYYKPEPSPVVDAALRTRTASTYAAFARYRLDRVENREDGYEVVMTDLRFSVERPNAFTCTIRLDGNLRVISERFSF